MVAGRIISSTRIGSCRAHLPLEETKPRQIRIRSSGFINSSKELCKDFAGGLRPWRATCTWSHITLETSSSLIRSFCSECCRSFVPGNLTTFMAYHAIVPFHHACRPCELGNLNGVRVNSTEQEPGDCDVARADLTEQELGNCDVARADLTERELGNCDAARVDLTKQKLGNYDAARVDPTEQEPGNCDVARVDPTEQELGNCDVARADLTERELGNYDVARVDPTEQKLGNCDVRLLPRVSPGANPGIWPRG
ncbi:hypothetical protein BHE74_00042486 [Ensete ventricosum]|nr:hypothetical protein BHE74_00042486 [Ensete ventricosum]